MSTTADEPMLDAHPTQQVDGVEIIEPDYEPYAHAAGDKLRVAIASVVFVVSLLVAAVLSSLIRGAEDDVVKLTKYVPDAIAPVLNRLGLYMGVLAPIALVIAVAALRRLRVALMVMIAAAASYVAMTIISKALEVAVELPGSIGQLRFISYPGPAFLAMGGAIVTVLGPWYPRFIRRIGIITVAFVAFTRIASGSNLPYDVVMAIVLGWLVGSIVVAIFGSPNRHPAGHEVVEALRRAGMDIRRLALAGRGVRGSTVYIADTAGGDQRFVKVFSTDQRDADLLLQIYRWLRLRDAAAERPFSSLRRSVEHEALLALKAGDDGVPTARLHAVSPVDPDGMLLAFDCIDGLSPEGAGPDGISDEMLRSLWGVVAILQDKHIAHRDLRLAHFVVDGDGTSRLVDFSFSELAAEDFLLRTDIAEMLCSVAVEVGAHRAVTSAVDVLGTDRVAGAVGRLQPLALSNHTRKAVGAQDDLLEQLRLEVQKATGIEEVELEELARIRPRTILSLVVLFAAIYVLLPQLADVGLIREQLANATWYWLVPVVVFQCLTYVGAALGMVGSVPERVPLFPTMRVQVAAAFVDILAPAGFGGMALNTRYMQKRGVDPAVAVAGVGVNAIGGLVGHVLLLGGFLLWAGSGSLTTGNEQQVSAPWATTALFVVGGVLVLLAIGFALPPGRKLFRERVKPMVKDAMHGLAQLARRPKKLAEVMGGSVLVTLAFTSAFICTVQAFGGGPSVAALGAAYLAAWAVAVVAPTPGGLGALEIALLAALGKLGMNSEAAVSSVLVFRTFTFWLPVGPGWFMFQWLQKHKEF